MVELKPRCELFARAVAQGVSYTEAARRAGYSACSSRTAGSRLMRLPAVRGRVRELLGDTERPSLHTELFDRDGRRVGLFVAAPTGR
jgi:hypothetical protein